MQINLYQVSVHFIRYDVCDCIQKYYSLLNIHIYYNIIYNDYNHTKNISVYSNRDQVNYNLVKFYLIKYSQTNYLF